jgi:hypothetical protein
VGKYSGATYYPGNSIEESYLFKKDKRWCLSDSLTGSCVVSGTYPCSSVCPDIDGDIISTGICLTTTTTSACDLFDFSAYFDCDIELPTPTPTLPVTDTTTFIPTPTPTPTPTQTSLCNFVNMTISSKTISDSVTPTPTQTYSGVLTTSGLTASTLTLMGNLVFEGERVNKLIECETGIIYYVFEPIKSGSTQFSTGTTLQVILNNIEKCVTYVPGTSNSINAILNGINKVLTSCNDCAIPTATPVLPPTQTPQPTPTFVPPTPTPQLDTNKTYVYKLCNNSSITLASRYAGNNENIGDVTRYKFNSNIECWELINVLNVWDPTYPSSLVSQNYFSTATIEGSFNNCDDCLNPQTNTITKGSLILKTNTFFGNVPNNNYTLKINGNVVNNSIDVVVGSNYVIELSNIDTNLIINPRFEKIEVYNANNIILFSEDINNSMSFVSKQITMGLDDLRIDITINADNYIEP